LHALVAVDAVAALAVVAGHIGPNHDIEDVVLMGLVVGDVAAAATGTLASPKPIWMLLAKASDERQIILSQISALG
jgi:hypothetical protein